MPVKQALKYLIKSATGQDKIDILVGIPSYNEADSISFVVKQVDKGLQKYYPHGRHLIVNADNHSPDRTRSAFLKTATRNRKIYISTDPGVKGKGNNCFNIFQIAKKRNAQALLLVDADLKSITPGWVKVMLDPILTKGYQYITPVYLRHEYDGTITNNFCYPLLYGLLGHDLRQPIAGDFALSNTVCEYYLMQKWTKTVKNYGIDIFMTLAALFGGFRHAQVTLGAKIHKPSSPKLSKMFVEVINTLFKYLSNHKEVWLQSKARAHTPHNFGKEVKQPPLKLSFDYKATKEEALDKFAQNREAIKLCLTKTNYQRLEKMFKAKKLHINAKTWSNLVYDIFYTYDVAEAAEDIIIKALKPLYFARVVSYFKETLELSHEQSEIKIREQAKIFFQNRDYLLKKYK